jgi:DNA polymerase V
MRVLAVRPADIGAPLALPFFDASVPAGFPSPSEDYTHRPLDLNDLLVSHRNGTFYCRAIGDSMTGAGIQTGDLLVVDTYLDATDGRVVIAVVNNEFLVKRYRKLDGRVFLVADNPEYPPLEITSEMECRIWGVVTYVIHQV